tara:strand:+ start:340 stop:678 length:339 start_codon:yes stop_codon:yes gene_type:complete
MINKGAIVIEEYPINTLIDSFNGDVKLPNNKSVIGIIRAGKTTSPITTKPPEISRTISINDKGGATISGHGIFFFLKKIKAYLINNIIPKKEERNGSNCEVKSLKAERELYF